MSAVATTVLSQGIRITCKFQQKFYLCAFKLTITMRSIFLILFKCYMKNKYISHNILALINSDVIQSSQLVGKFKLPLLNYENRFFYTTAFHMTIISYKCVGCVEYCRRFDSIFTNIRYCDTYFQPCKNEIICLSNHDITFQD